MLMLYRGKLCHRGAQRILVSFADWKSWYGPYFHAYNHTGWDAIFEYEGQT